MTQNAAVDVFGDNARVLRAALENAGDALEGRLFELDQMARIGRLFASSARLEEVAARGLEILLEATPAENGSIMLYFKEGDDLCMLAAGTRSGKMTFYGLDGNPLKLFGWGEGLAGHSLAAAKAIVATDVANEPRFKPQTGRMKIGSAACLPMHVDGKPLGVINLSHPDTGALCAADAAMWTLLAGYLAVALSNAILLTQLRNSNERLQAEVDARTKSLSEANDRLQAAQEKIARNNEELKLKVEERSAELGKTLTELRRRTDSLERANRIKDEFLNNINHELKTPLNAVIGYAGLLLQEAESLPQEQRADLEVIESNGKHLQQIIDNILALKEIDGGKLEPEYIRSDLEALLKMAVASVAPRARAKGLSVTLDDSSERLPPFLFDPTLMRRVIYNLLDNAIKFSSLGEIRVKTSILRGDAGGFDAAIVEISDQGRGVKPEDVERIFQKFQQGEPAMIKQEGGSGVGLTIARTLVELHRGELKYAPLAGGGSVFSFKLPLRS